MSRALSSQNDKTGALILYLFDLERYEPIKYEALKICTQRIT